MALFEKYTRPSHEGAPLRSQAPIDAPFHGSDERTTGSFVRTNLGAPLAYFCIAYVSYGLAGWLPTVLTSTQFSLSTALQASLFHNLLALVGVARAHFMIRRRGSRLLLILCCGTTLALVAAFAVLLMLPAAARPTTPLPLFTVVALLGLTTGAATTGIFTVATMAYPPIADRVVSASP